MKNKYLLSIQADDGPTVLNKITALLNRRKLTIISLSMTRSDVHDIVNFNIELLCSYNEIENLQTQIEKVIEVFGAMITIDYDHMSQQVAFFKLNNDILKTGQSSVIQTYGAQIVKLYSDALVISKSGSGAVIQELYNRLEGKYLIGFAQSGIVADTQFLNGIQLDDTVVVRRSFSGDYNDAKISGLAA
jgi:acetolactate synthase-1/3 small subunit